MSHDAKAITIKMPNNKLPLLWNNKIILQKELLPLKGNVKVIKPLQYQEDLLYESRPGDFLSGDVQEAVIVNRLNKLNSSCRTIVKGKSLSGQAFEKTSDELAKLIGQNNYDRLFSAVCSVFNQEIKIRGIYSMLTIPKTTNSFACQVGDEKMILDNLPAKNISEKVDMHCQTEESYISTLKKNRSRKRTKRSQLTPYVIREEPEQKKPKRVVIPPSNFGTILKNVGNIKQEESQKEEFPDLGSGRVFDEDSNNSNHSATSIGRLSALSVKTTPELMHNPMGMIIANVDKLTRDNDNHQKETYTLHDFDSGKVTHVNEKPTLVKPPLHSVSHQQRIQKLLEQGLHDYNTCLQRDESGHLPIHAAVLNNDIVLLKRQCLVLRMKGISVDIPADNLTPLKMSLYQENVGMTSLLLQYNADVLETDAQDITYFHITAAMATEHLQVLINHCRHNARKILEDDTQLWKPEYVNRSDEDLARILFRHINDLSNEQGYTPLMVASKSGLYENVKILVESAPDMVNNKMRTSGKTALLLAVAAACMDCTDRGNKAKVVDHFRKTIEILLENGADPNSKNFDGTTVNDLLTEYNIADLSMLIANKMTYRNFGDAKLPPGSKGFDSFMLVKDECGNVDIKNIEKTPRKPRAVKSPRVTKKSPAVNNIAHIPPLCSPKQTLIIKSETITVDKSPPNISGSNNYYNKTEFLNKMSKVQNFKLNKPLLLKSNDKRQLEITIEQSNKSLTND